MVESWKVLHYLQTNKKHDINTALPEQWFHANKINANLHSRRFEDGQGTGLTSIPLWEEVLYVLFTFSIFGVFFWLPLLVGLLCFVIPTKVMVASLCVLIGGCYVLPVE